MILLFCCPHVFLMTRGLRGQVKTGRLKTRQRDRHRGQYFIVFCPKIKAPTHWHAHTNTKWFLLPSPPFYFSLFHHSHFDWQFTRGGDCIPTRRSRFAVCQTGYTGEEKHCGRKEGWDSDITGWEGRSLLFMFLLDVFTLQPHVPAVMCLTRTVSGFYLYWF